jgi:hypothetical protein
MALLVAGLIAALRQLLAVVLTTIVVWFLAREGAGNWLSAPPSSIDNLFSATATTVLLPWCYLIIAIGISLTRDRRLDAAAKEIYGGARPTNPALAKVDAEEVYGRFLITSVVLAIPVLSPAPTFLTELSRTMGFHEFGPLAWAGVFSSGIAATGTIAHAGQRALHAVDPRWRDHQD